MRRYKNLVISFVILLLAPLSASAEVPVLSPLGAETRYDVTLGGVGIGRIRITAVEDTFGYRMVVDTKSRGIVDMVAPLKSVARVRGALAEGRYVPTLYESKSTKDGNDRNRRVTIAYDGEGRVTTRERVPGDDPKWRPVVPLERLESTTDPMTGFFVLRQALRDAMARNEREASVTTYDGARLVTAKLKVVSRAKVEVNGKYVNAINTVLTRHPITGYTPKELKKFEAGDPVVHVYFSADAKLTPMMATVSLFYGDLKATLVESKPAK